VPATVAESSTPALKTSSVPPLLIRVASAVDPEETTSTPPVLTVVPEAKPPDTKNSVPPLIVSPNAEPTTKLKLAMPLIVSFSETAADQTTSKPLLTSVPLTKPKSIRSPRFGCPKSAQGHLSLSLSILRMVVSSSSGPTRPG